MECVNVPPFTQPGSPGPEGRARIASSSSGSGPVTPTEVRLGKFKVVQVLGKGAMGKVFRAVDTTLDRQVALKVLTLSQKQDHEVQRSVERFFTEARSAARLDHPHIVRIYEITQVKQYHCIAMELVEGGNLEDLVKQAGPLEPARACSLAADAADALEYAHRCGVIHRDVKPANLMLSGNGRCKLADFGLARLAEQALQEAGGGAVGTPLYVAPEVIAGQPGGPMADLYSLGATLFFLLTGRPPYLAQTRRDVLNMHLRSPVPDPREYRKDLPDAVVDMVRQAMAKAPESRYGSAAAFAAILRAYAIPISIQTSGNLIPLTEPAAAQRPKWLYPAIAGAAVVVLTGLIALFSGLGTTAATTPTTDALAGPQPYAADPARPLPPVGTRTDLPPGVLAYEPFALDPGLPLTGQLTGARGLLPQIRANRMATATSGSLTRAGRTGTANKLVLSPGGRALFKFDLGEASPLSPVRGSLRTIGKIGSDVYLCVQLDGATTGWGISLRHEMEGTTTERVFVGAGSDRSESDNIILQLGGDRIVDSGRRLQPGTVHELVLRLRFEATALSVDLHLDPPSDGSLERPIATASASFPTHAGFETIAFTRYDLAHAGPRTLLVGSTGRVQKDGILDDGEYGVWSTGVGEGFDDVIGVGSRLCWDIDANGNVGLALLKGPGKFNDQVVIYIDNTRGGGFRSTAGFTDEQDSLRRAISARVESFSSEVRFPPGFTPTHAIGIERGYAGLWKLANDAQHTSARDLGLIPTAEPLSSVYEMSFRLADIGLQPGDSFRYIATLLNSTNSYRSNEFHGVRFSTVGGQNLGAVPLVLNDADFNTVRTNARMAPLAPDAPLIVDELRIGTNYRLMARGR